MVWLIVVLSYMIGSIPTAYLAGRFLRKRDIRGLADGNVGAANAFRQLGARIGITVFFIDAAKGALAIIIAQAANAPQLTIFLAGAAAVIGHNWPVFLNFRGGKGFSTTIGNLTALMPQPMLMLAAPTLAALVIKRNTTLAGAVMFAPLPLVCWLLGIPPAYIAYGVALPCLVGYTNLIRTRRTTAIAETETE
jgi:glycerol-3-phosphate acyltransferase PlsY